MACFCLTSNQYLHTSCKRIYCIVYSFKSSTQFRDTSCSEGSQFYEACVFVLPFHLRGLAYHIHHREAFHVGLLEEDSNLEEPFLELLEAFHGLVEPSLGLMGPSLGEACLVEPSHMVTGTTLAGHPLVVHP